MTARLDPQPWMTAAPSRRLMAALNAARPGGARFVGGCVRNALLGEPVSDIDIATQLTPDRVEAVCRAAGMAVHPTGIEHGTLTIVADRAVFEVTTLRRDVETDGRRATVAFTEDWAEDAGRRDFRLNALYAGPDGELFDPTGGGLADVEARRIVFVGDPDTRIREDYLRILRLFRFFAWYGRGAPDADAMAACARLKGGLKTVSVERIWMETRKLLAAPDPMAGLEAMQVSGVLAQLFPEMTAFGALAGLLEVERRTGEAPDPLLRLLTVLPRTAEALGGFASRLKLSNAERDRLLAGVRRGAEAAQSLAPDIDEPALRRLLYVSGQDTVADLARLKWAEAPDRTGWAPVLERVAAWRRPVLPLTGDDLLAAGVEPGPAVGQAMRTLEAAWIASDFTLDRAALLARLAA